MFILTALFAIVVALGWLVLLLYRAVDRAYTSKDGPSPGLEYGSDFPAFEIVGDEGLRPLAPSNVSADSISAVLFASNTCETCRAMFSAGLPPELSDVPITVLVTQGDSFRYIEAIGELSNVTVEYLADPADAWHLASVDQIPFLYVLHRQKVMEGGLVTSFNDVTDTVFQARKTLTESSTSGG